LAEGKFGSIARAKFVRHTDPEFWARSEEIEQLFDGVDDDVEWSRAHGDAARPNWRWNSPWPGSKLKARCVAAPREE
jgi:hypothetical protein